ncbi:ADP-dependent NAD(P)H-hydrate dehydratase [Elizabethkingia argenteiflava]|uniref:ADP-dependent NAD(P)H-hydrate dehydratase n=1 Tax=Elizabethkingia argenteiflava TaxID=2681556 RepID=UPI00293BC4DF|nr:NAD(P)H-hydrate dehydratase [Elizabethkingia argenteiflava]
MGSWRDDFEKLEKVREIAQQYTINIIIKGAHSLSVLSDAQCYFNSTRPGEMATAGSGDTLSGILSSLYGQGYSPHETCILGVYLHGLCGDIACRKIHPHALIASDIANFISAAYFDLEQ